MHLYINLSRSRDCIILLAVCGWVGLNFDSQLRASFTYFGQLLRYAHQCIVNIMKVYIERNNIQVELIPYMIP